ncbi:MAG: hypothetical protein AB1491_04270 [Thermodesulfobacteriota bacterium]
MRVFIWSLAVTFLAFALHLLIWKIRLPHRQMGAIVRIFLGALAFSLGGAFLAGLVVPAWQPYLPGTPWEYLHITLFVLVVLMAYLITYTALEADSPTVVMVAMIRSAGPGGLEREKFERALSDDLLVVPRCRDLLRDGLACLEGDRYRLTGKGRFLARLFSHYRRVLDLGLGG